MDVIQATTLIGHELAKNKYGLITGGWQGVDRIVSESFPGALETRKLPLDNFVTQVVEQSWEPPFRAGRLRLPSIHMSEKSYVEIGQKRASRQCSIKGEVREISTRTLRQAIPFDQLPAICPCGLAAEYVSRI